MMTPTALTQKEKKKINPKETKKRKIITPTAQTKKKKKKH